LRNLPLRPVHFLHLCQVPTVQGKSSDAEALAKKDPDCLSIVALDVVPAPIKVRARLKARASEMVAEGGAACAARAFG
jgi:hypothetical protein